MSVGIQRLLEAQSVNVDFSGNGLSAEYMVVLNHLWNCRYESAADHASTILADEEDHPATSRLYRAWIEALSELGDQDSLAMLANHLLALGRVDEELKQTYLALRGVIHLYLDQAPAARLVLRAIQGRDLNPYCLEFEEMCARRGFEGANEFAIAQSRIAINDWFHWNTLIADLSAFGSDIDELHEVLTYTNRAFPGSPALDYANMHRAIDSGYWPGALASATKLHTNFPDNPDYGFMKAFSAFQGGDSDLALSTLQGLGDYANTADADVLHLTGEILAGKALYNDNERTAKLAIQKLDQAARLYRRAGKPIDQALTLIHRLERQIISDTNHHLEADGFRAPRSWMVMLTPSQYANLSTSGDQDVAVLHRPMGREAMPGDIVLFMTKSAHIAKQPSATNQEWRIVAVYRVTTKPYWHPTNRWQNGLELVDRPDSPIPIDAKDVGSDWNVRGKKYSLPRGHHARYSVYELDDSAMDIVVSAVKRRSDGIEHDQDRRGVNLSKKDSV
jgi:tetratricopeptide (TPR) repeat protein